MFDNKLIISLGPREGKAHELPLTVHDLLKFSPDFEVDLMP